ETRISFVDKLVTFRFELYKAAPSLDRRLSKLWDGIKGKIDALKGTRNAIVHGTMSHFAPGNDLYKQGPRLTPPFGDTLRSIPPVRAGQPPGLGSNELKVHE